METFSRFLGPGAGGDLPIPKTKSEEGNSQDDPATRDEALTIDEALDRVELGRGQYFGMTVSL